MTNVTFAGDSAQSYTVTFAGGADGRRGIVLGGINIPTQARAQAHAMLGPTFKRQDPRYANQKNATSGAGALALANPPIANSEDSGNATSFASPVDAAIFLIYHHPDILALDPVTAALIIDQHIETLPSVLQLAEAIGVLGVAQPLNGDPALTGWARAEFVLDNGQKIPLTTNSGKSVPGQFEWTWVPDASLSVYLDVAVRETLSGVRDDKNLEGRRFGIDEARALVTDPARFTDPVIREQSAARARAAATATYDWTADRSEWDAGQFVSGISGSVDTFGNRVLNVDVANSYSRYLTVYAAFTDANGVIQNRSEVDRLVALGTPLGTQFARFLGVVTPPTYFFGAKIGGNSQQTFSIGEIQSKVSGVAICTGSVRWGRDHLTTELEGVDNLSIILTAVLNFGLPSILLAYGAYSAAQVTWKSLEETMIATSIESLVRLTVTLASASANWTSFGVFVATNVLKRALASEKFLGEWLGLLASGQAASSVPIFGWAMFAVSALNSGAAMLRTSIDMGSSRSVVRTNITSTNPVTFTFRPQDALGFPRTAATFALKLTPSGGNTAVVATGSIKSTDTVLTKPVAKVISGGTVIYRLELLSATGAVVGVSEGQWLNVLPGGSAAITINDKVKNTVFVLTAQTRYRPQEQLIVDSDGKHIWMASAALPPPGKPRLTCGDGVEAVCAPGGVTLSAVTGQVGFAWQLASPNLPVCSQPGTGGTAVFTMQNLNLNATIDKKAPDATFVTLSCGERRPVLPLYCLSEARSFVLEANVGTYHLRAFEPAKLPKTASDRDPRFARSWGQFISTRLTAAALHKSGRVLALSGDADKMELLEIPATVPSDDFTAPQAALKGGLGSTLPGNIKGAVAVCALDDADIFLVLEDTNKRVQAFGIDGQPDPTFLGGQAFLALEKGYDYLDISYDSGNKAIFVLSRKTGGTTMQDFVLNILRLDGSTIVRLPAFPAARMTVDNNQNVFAVNWETLKFQGLPQPGLTIWVPT